MATAYFCDHCGAENAHGETICHACQHPLALPSAFEESGTLLNERYAILSEIGAGGFGAVYKARDTREGERLVAVKQINLQGLSSQEIIEATDAFNREAEILTTLSHPLLPTIFDRFSDPEHWYLVMTYIDGSTLDEYLQQHQITSLPASTGLPLGETLTIALQLCDALHYLHTQQPPVIFRDLKPGNIMRTRKGLLYLIDFGIARRFKPGQLKDTIPFGSPGFAAPEQYGKAQTTPQADIYSLGALLSCLITGDDPSEHPFDFSSLHHYDIAGTRELDTLIHRMVALNPLWRPANIQEVQAELQRIQQLNIKANQQGRLWTPPPGQTPPPPGSGQQHIFLNPASTQQQTGKTTRRTVLTTTLVLGGIAAFGGVIALANQPQSQFQSQQISQVDPNQGFWDQQTVEAQNSTAVAANQTPTVPLNGPTYWSPDLNYAAVVNSPQQQIELYKVAAQQPIQTIEVPANFISPLVSWSPDNSKILAQSDSGAIYAWNVTNGVQLFGFTSAMAGYNPSTPAAISWSPDGLICAISYLDQNNNLNITLLNANNGNQLFQKQLLSPNNVVVLNNPVSNVAWSPDNRYFAFPDATGWPEGQSWLVGIWDRGTYRRINSFGGALTPAVNGTIPTVYSVETLVWSPGGQKLATGIEYTTYISQLGNSPSTATLPYVDLSSETPTYSFRWSPDEQYFAVYAQQGLSVYNTSNGKQVALNNNGFTPQGNVAAFAWATDSKSVTMVDNNNNISHWSVE